MAARLPRSTADLVAGTIFIALGAAFAIGALRYDVGSLLGMGPGYVPLALGAVLAVLGVATVVKAYVAPDLAPEEVSTAVEDGRASDGGGAAEPEDAVRPLAGIKWRPLLFVMAGIVFFAYTVDGLGLLPASFGAGLLAALAGSRLPRALLVSAGLTVASYIIFVVLLQLRLSLVGDWLGG
ncbi:tripartite tricarboxylate transporter TctB family protein [Antribacter sp. KLBMP9083]|uniref:Tripartite tricarboxylate transporter TctB family protein n=1 Tax=Antribacter soli TaxID=2910976 RepID=A0AA41QDX7_9MICO|nr:tripartite tricarboxylate transporter TctB family protein [Antribacter soli]MCF4121684.1 tripartite tricarboxylate transporter TctB family protein [Antribacter soli]